MTCYRFPSKFLVSSSFFFLPTLVIPTVFWIFGFQSLSFVLFDAISLVSLIFSLFSILSLIPMDYEGTETQDKSHWVDWDSQLTPP